jgi:hypothetical protein
MGDAIKAFQILGNLKRRDYLGDSEKDGRTKFIWLRIGTR